MHRQYFLAACKIHGDLELAQFEDSPPIVLMSNIYSDSGKWDAAENTRKIKTSSGKEPGLSWVLYSYHSNLRIFEVCVR